MDASPLRGEMELVRHEFACKLRGETELRGLGGIETYLVVGRRAVPHTMPAEPESAAAT